MNLIKVKKKSQITIPKEVREKLGVEPGDYFNVDTKGDKIVLTPQVISPKGEVSNLSKKGEKGLKESLNQLKKGEISVYENVNDMVDALSD